MMVIPENERSGSNPTQINPKQGNHANALVLLQMHPSQEENRRRETSGNRWSKSNFFACFFVRFFLSLKKGVARRSLS